MLIKVNQILVCLVEADLDSIREEWLKSNGQSQIKEIAKHYGIYEHLFGYAHFTPRIPLDIKVNILSILFSIVA